MAHDSIIRLVNPTGRNTQAHRLDLGPHEFYFSYETLIAYNGPGLCARIDNSWGPTTGRHFSELGCRNFEILAQDQFDAAMARILKPLSRVYA